MSADAGASGRWSRLAPMLRPLEREPQGAGRARLVESTLLVIVAVLLATAVINDVVRQVGVDHRLSADVRTWRAYTHHGYHNLTVDEQLLGSASEHEVVCGNTLPGPPKTSTQLCLEIWGPVRGGVRTVHGGWLAAAHSEDVRSGRRGCFGDALPEELCPR